MFTPTEFSYEDAEHIYTDNEGIVRPSVTQCLALGGVFDYSMVPIELLERKKIIGNNVHDWTADYDTGLDPDPTQLTEEEAAYAQGWIDFVRDTRPEWVAIEQPMMGSIHGTIVAGRPDRIAIINRKLWVIDLKCCAAHHPGWKLQTAGYEMLYTKRPTVGAMGRMSVRLTPDGRYVPNQKPYDDPHDAVAFAAFAQSATWMKNNHLARPPI